MSPPGEIPSLLTHSRLVQSVHGSQMQVQLDSGDFGLVTVHAGFGRNNLSAQISVDHAELSATIAARLPGVEQKLASDHGLSTSVRVSSGAPATPTGAAPSGGGGGSGNHRPSSGPDGNPPRASAGLAYGRPLNGSSRSTFAGGPELTATSASVTALQGSAGRLDIRI